MPGSLWVHQSFPYTTNTPHCQICIFLYCSCHARNSYSGHVEHILLTTHLMWKGQSHHWDLQGVRHHRRRGLKMCLCDSKNTLCTDTDKHREQGKERVRGEREREREGLQRGIMKSWMNWMQVKRFWLQQPHYTESRSLSMPEAHSFCKELTVLKSMWTPEHR